MNELIDYFENSQYSTDLTLHVQWFIPSEVIYMHMYVQTSYIITHNYQQVNSFSPISVTTLQ